MNFKKKLMLLLACSIIFVSQLGLVEAMVKPDQPIDSTKNVVSPVLSPDNPITTFSNPKPVTD